MASLTFAKERELRATLNTAFDALEAQDLYDAMMLIRNLDAGTFEPASLFAGGAVGAYYDASDMSSLFQDAAGTIPVTAAGQTVKRMNDLSGNGNHLTISNASVNVTYGTLNERPCLIAPAGSFLAMPTANKDVNYSTYIASAFAPSTTGSFPFFGAGSSAANGLWLRGVASGSRVSTVQMMTGKTNVEITTPGAAAPLGVPVVIDLQGGPTVSSWINGGSTEFADPTNSNGGARNKPGTWAEGDKVVTARYGVNSSGGLSQSTSGQVFFAGIIYDGDIGSVRAKVHRWLREKAGLLSLDGHAYDVFLVTGQSNAQGVGNVALSTQVPYGAAVEYQKGGYIKPLTDPTQHKAPTDYSLSGSAWPAFATKYNELTGRKVCVVGYAASGRGILQPASENWGNGANGILPTGAATKLREALDYLRSTKSTPTVRGALYLGGEQDATLTLNLATYKGLLVTLRDRFRAETGIPTLPLLILSIDNKADDEADYALLRQAMAEAATENEGIHLVMPYQNFLATGEMTDAVHWNQVSLNAAGEIAATNTAALFT